MGNTLLQETREGISSLPSIYFRALTCKARLRMRSWSFSLSQADTTDTMWPLLVSISVSQLPPQPGKGTPHPSQHKSRERPDGSSMAQWGPSAWRGHRTAALPPSAGQTDGHRPQQCLEPTRACNIPPCHFSSPCLLHGEGRGDRSRQRGSRRIGVTEAWVDQANENLLGLFEKPMTVPVS